MASKIVVVVGMIIACIGIAIVAAPEALLRVPQRLASPAGVAFAGGGRVALGVIFWLASDQSRTPRTLKVIAVLAVLGGITLLVIGVPGLTSLIEWGTSQGNTYWRAAGAIAACLGAFLAWSAMPPKGDE